MIEPGIGRIVHFRHEASNPGDKPHAAMIIDFSDARHVNLACFTPDGTYYHREGVPLLQDDDAAPEGVGYAEWMPFQKRQAVKTEAAEDSLHPRIAALEQVLTAGGPFHTMVEDLQTGLGDELKKLQTDLDAKLRELGDWTVKKFGEVDAKLAPPPLAPEAAASLAAHMANTAAAGESQPNPPGSAPQAEQAAAQQAQPDISGAGAAPQAAG